MKKNVEIGKKIKEIRDKKGWSLQDLADKVTKKGFKVNPSSIHRIEIGERERIDVFMLDKLSEVLGFDFLSMINDNFTNGHQLTYKIKKESIKYNLESPKTVTLQVYGMASAGTGALDFDVETEDFLLPADFKIPNNSFIIKVKGDSMEPNFLDGDRILVDTSKCGDWQFMVDYPVVVQINEERFLKVVKFNNYKPEFHSINKFYEPIKIENGDTITCVGIVTDILKRKVGKIKI